MMKNYAVIQSGRVANMIVLDGEPVEVPGGAQVHLGDVWDGRKFNPSPEREEASRQEEAARREEAARLAEAARREEEVRREREAAAARLEEAAEVVEAAVAAGKLDTEEVAQAYATIALAGAARLRTPAVP